MFDFFSPATEMFQFAECTSRPRLRLRAECKMKNVQCKMKENSIIFHCSLYILHSFVSLEAESEVGSRGMTLEGFPHSEIFGW